MQAGKLVRVAVVVAALAALWPAHLGCRVIKLQEAETETPQVHYRIENATASTSDVILDLSNDSADETTSTSTEEGVDSARKPVAAQLITEADLPANVIVRIAPGTYSEGTLVCSEELIISALTGEDFSIPVLFEGDGAGTTGFDEASVGASGERRLTAGIHFSCGETVVIRIEDDGSGVGASSSSDGLGMVNVYAADEVPPVGFLPVIDDSSAEGEAGDDSASTPDPAEPETVSATIDNQTGSGILVEYLVGTGDPETDQKVSVAVLPFSEANGTLACAQLITVTALILDSDSGQAGTEPTLYQVTLFGSGTGTIGFDEPTIGPGNSRFLVLDEHFDCGETVLLTILDDAGSIDEEQDEQARIGVGSVEVMTADQ